MEFDEKEQALENFLQSLERADIESLLTIGKSELGALKNELTGNLWGSWNHIAYYVKTEDAAIKLFQYIFSYHKMFPNLFESVMSLTFNKYLEDLSWPQKSPQIRKIIIESIEKPWEDCWEADTEEKEKQYNWLLGSFFFLKKISILESVKKHEDYIKDFKSTLLMAISQCTNGFKGKYPSEIQELEKVLANL